VASGERRNGFDAEAKRAESRKEIRELKGK
jgi:hypothetical protein